MKIAIVNQPLGNRGDEAAHRALVRGLAKKFPEAKIDIIFLNENQQMINDIIVNNGNVKYINYRGMNKASNKCMKLTMLRNNMYFTLLHPLLRKFYNAISKYDCVICAPGGICMGGFMKWDHIWQLYIAMKHGIKILYWGRSIGPFSDEDSAHSDFKKISERLIKYFSYISLRDEISFEIAQKMNVLPDKTVDSAFLETPCGTISEIIRKEIGKEPYVIFVPNELRWHYKYKDKSKSCIDGFYLHIIDKLITSFPGHRVVMLPQTCKTVINDFGYFVELKEQSRHKNNIIVIDENQSSDIQQEIVRKSSFVVGARYHSVVFAINNNVPFLSLSYEHKMRGMLDTLGLDDRQINIEEIFNESEVADTILKAVDDKLSNTSSVQKEAEKAKSIVENAFNRMCSRI